MRKTYRVFGLVLLTALFLGSVSVVPAVGDQDRGIRCLRPMLRQYEAMLRPEAERIPEGSDQLTPPPNPDVGDSWLWYIWHLSGFPWAEQRMCTVRGEGQNVYVVVEDSQWQVNVFQDDVDAVVEYFDNSSVGPYPTQGIWDLNTTHFGDPPDRLDNDPKIYVLFYAFDVSADGFWWVYDEYLDGTQPFASNECEVVYINSAAGDPGGTYLNAVVAHEFQHMIHWNQDPNEDLWVDEGCGELAMWLFGNPDPIVGFNAMPDNNLTDWSGAFADYVQVYLWTLYFFEHYGGQPAIYQLVHEPLNGIYGYEATLDNMGYTESFADVFADWVVANYVDDETFLDGRYGYAGADLPPFNASQYSNYPVGPVNASVQHWASDYVRFIDGQPLTLDFDGADYSTFAARVVTYASGQPLDLVDIPLDDQQAGSLPLPEFGNAYDTVVLVVANLTSGAGSVPYSFGTSGSTGLPGDIVGADPILQVLPHPLRSGGEIRLRLAGAGPFALELFDASGRLVWSRRGHAGADGLVRLPFVGGVANGVYFARVRGAGMEASRRILVVD
jgi:hypothetical protein